MERKQRKIKSISGNDQLESFMHGLVRRNPGEVEYHQAVYEVVSHIIPYTFNKPLYHEAKILERLSEPDRVVIFRVTWEDDNGNYRVNRGYRVQHNNAIGPYKGGIRFHRDVTLSTLKFLAFEQTLKNSLTGLPLGGAKGGADFNPKGKSDREVMRFCQAFMTELSRYIGDNIDIPAGDIGVGPREISYMFGQYKRLTNKFTGMLTGKSLEYGGSEIRTESTGYGCVYIAEDALRQRGIMIDGSVAAVSGAGNVAQYTIEKFIELGGKVVTVSDSSGYIYDSAGIDHEKLEYIKYIKNVQRKSLKQYADKFKASYFPDERPWNVPCDLAFPCATQNELDGVAAKKLLQNGCFAIIEGANMPVTQAGVDVFQKARVIFVPSKAANAGGVAISGLELSQNSMRMSWSRELLNTRLREIMSHIHDQCVEHGLEHDNYVNYLKGANIAGFIKVSSAMVAFGIT